METKVSEKYIDESRGFPVVLREVPLKKVREEWILDIDLKRFQEGVVLGLVFKPGALTGDEVRFLRQWLELTVSEFGERFGVTHPAVVNWESKGSDATNMSKGTEMLLRLDVLSALPDEVWQRYEVGESEDRTSLARQTLRAYLEKLSELGKGDSDEAVELYGAALELDSAA